MKAKKLLAISLAVLILLLAFPITAFAETTYIAEVTVYNPYETNTTTVTQCATWSEAITAATAYNAYNVNGDYSVRKNIVATIKLLQPELTLDNMPTISNVSLVVDGEYSEGEKATVTCPNGYWISANNNVTVKNVSINMTYAQGAAVRSQRDANADAEIIIENVDFMGYLLVNSAKQTKNITVSDSTLTLGHRGYAIDQNFASTVTFDNCIITKAAGNGYALFRTSGTGDSTLNLHNTTATQNGGETSWVYGSVFSHESTGLFTVNMTGSTTINSNSNMTGAVPMFFGWNHPIAVNIGSDTDDGSGVILNLGPAEGETCSTTHEWPSFFKRVSSLKVNDKGGNWMVNEAHSTESGKYGARFYYDDNNGSISSIDDVLALTQDGSFYNPFNCNIPAGTFKTIMSSETFVENRFGAQIRTVDPDGIRFQTYVNNDYYTLFGDNATYGMKATTKDILGTGTVAGVAGITAAAENWLVDGESFLTVLTGFENATYRTVFCVNSYMTLTYDTYNGVGGGSVTVWADYSDNANARSIWQVAKAALEDPNYTYSAAQQAYLENIVNSTVTQ